jgi:hypothetical protein
VRPQNRRRRPQAELKPLRASLASVRKWPRHLLGWRMHRQLPFRYTPVGSRLRPLLAAPVSTAQVQCCPVWRSAACPRPRSRSVCQGAGIGTLQRPGAALIPQGPAVRYTQNKQCPQQGLATSSAACAHLRLRVLARDGFDLKMAVRSGRGGGVTFGCCGSPRRCLLEPSADVVRDDDTAGESVLQKQRCAVHNLKRGAAERCHSSRPCKFRHRRGGIAAAASKASSRPAAQREGHGEHSTGDARGALLLLLHALERQRRAQRQEHCSSSEDGGLRA